MWNTDICWSFQMDFKATSIYICRWMVKALYRLFFQYNVNVLGFQNMLHVYDVKRFFLLCSAIRGCLKNLFGKWRYSVKQLEGWKFYNKRNMHIIMCCAIVLCENVQYFMCMISYVKCKHRFEAFHAVDEIWKRRGSISVSYFTGDT